MPKYVFAIRYPISALITTDITKRDLHEMSCNCFHYSRLGLLMMVTPREYFAPICAQVDPEA